MTEPTLAEREDWAARGVIGDEQLIRSAHADGDSARLFIHLHDGEGGTDTEIVDFGDPDELGWATEPYGVVLFRTTGRRIIAWSGIWDIVLNYGSSHRAHKQGDPQSGLRGFDKNDNMNPGGEYNPSAPLEPGDFIEVSYRTPNGQYLLRGRLADPQPFPDAYSVIGPDGIGNRMILQASVVDGPRRYPTESYFFQKL